MELKGKQKGRQGAVDGNEGPAEGAIDLLAREKGDEEWNATQKKCAQVATPTDFGSGNEDCEEEGVRGQHQEQKEPARIFFAVGN
jgi:hypothetical protein